MIPRYTRPELGALWTDEARMDAWRQVELAACEELPGLLGADGPTTAELHAIRGASFTVDEVRERELVTEHDVAAFVDVLAASVGEGGRWIHFGLTSSDVLDTALALQLRAVGEVIVDGARALSAAFVARAREHARTLCVGRTHGVHAEPTSFGIKLAGFAFEADRNAARLQRAFAQVAVGAVSGAVGTYAATSPEFEARVLDRLGLAREDVSTQVVPRDRHAELLGAIALAGAGLERFATEVRHLQRTEVRELQEPFRAGQKGSSSMPHKRNPIKSEQIAGLARVLRGNAQAALENVTLWHERDISHSSVERVILPDSTILLDYLQHSAIALVDGMTVDAERMLANLELTHGALVSQRVLLALVEAGSSRDDAYRAVQELAQRAWVQGIPLRDLLAADERGRELDLAEIFDYSYYLRHADEILARLDQIACAALPARPIALVASRHVSTLADLPLIASGKVREMYDLGSSGSPPAQGARPALLMVASDRISTYDAVHPTPIPDKGKVLTGLSVFWFQKTAAIVANHLISSTDGVPEEARGRALVVRRLNMLPVECVVRGYITGSGWKDYQASGSVSGVALPEGLRESERLPEPIFTPSTKAEEGHDEAIDFEGAVALVGDRALMERVRDVSVELYSFAAEHARANGVILADTKFEFGLDQSDLAAGRPALVLGDEVLTPDSSRYWPADGYQVGRGQPSFDKQYVRDWASASGWDKKPPAPAIPEDVVAGTRARYVEAYERIAGEPFQAWLERTGASAGAT